MPGGFETVNHRKRVLRGSSSFLLGVALWAFLCPPSRFAIGSVHAVACALLTIWHDTIDCPPLWITHSCTTSHQHSTVGITIVQNPSPCISKPSACIKVGARHTPPVQSSFHAPLISMQDGWRARTNVPAAPIGTTIFVYSIL